MKLTFDQIALATQGAVRVQEDSEGIVFYRFTEEQEALYRREHPRFLNKVFATAGITLAFSTDSESLTLQSVRRLRPREASIPLMWR